MQKKRSNVYDNVKFFLILCVILGHLGNRYAKSSHLVASAQFWVYIFHMPAFILISGMFSKRVVRERQWSRVVPYLFLFVFMNIFGPALTTLRSGNAPGDLDFFHETGIPWFALGMFWWYTVTILVQNVHPAYVMGISLLLSFASGYSTGVGSFLSMQRSLVFYPFFYLGYLLDPMELQNRIQKWKYRIPAAMILIGTFIFTYFKYSDISFWRILFRAICAYSKIGKGMNYAWGWTWRLAAYVISLVMTLCVISLTPDVASVFSRLGQKTLPIYVFHGTFIALSLKVVPGLSEWMTTRYLPINCLIFMMVIAFVTSLKPFEWLVNLIMTVPSRKKSEAVSEFKK